MSRIYLIGLVSLGMFSAAASGGTAVVDRNQIVQTFLHIQRQDVGGAVSYEQQYVFFDSNDSLTVAPNFQTTSSAGSGSSSDTNDVFIVSGSGSGKVDSTLAYNGSDLSSYSVAGNLEGSLESGTLSAYEPNSVGPEVDVRVVSIYNAAFSFTTDVPVPYSFTATQFNTVGNAFTGAQLFLDVNGDHDFNAGDTMIEAMTFSADGTDLRTGVLAPSAFEYRVFFSGNTFDGTTSDDMSLSSSVEFSGGFTVVPEPAALSVLALAGLALCRRQISRR